MIQTRQGTVPSENFNTQEGSKLCTCCGTFRKQPAKKASLGLVRKRQISKILFFFPMFIVNFLRCTGLGAWLQICTVYAHPHHIVKRYKEVPHGGKCLEDHYGAVRNAFLLNCRPRRPHFVAFLFLVVHKLGVARTRLPCDANLRVWSLSWYNSSGDPAGRCTASCQKRP